MYELEELADELKGREADLNADLRSADEAFESSKTHYESLVAALKDARRKLQSDLDELHAQHKADTERLRQELQDRETHLTRTKREVEDARERVAMRDRDLVKVQNALKGLENERRKLGDEATSDKFGLELEMERLRRDLDGAEGDLEEAREALAKRDMEYSAMVRQAHRKWGLTLTPTAGQTKRAPGHPIGRKTGTAQHVGQARRGYEGESQADLVDRG